VSFERIREEELAAVGVELLDDQPGLAPDAMKAKFEETAKELLAPKYNKLADQLEAETASESLGAKVPEGLPEETEKTVQAVLLALMLYVQAHEKNRENPHAVTADQVGAYTKAQTDKAINDKVVAIGGGDMAMSVYDPDMLKKPIYKAIDDAVAALKKLVLDKEHYDPQGKCKDIFATIDAAAPKYEAKLSIDGWVASTSEEQANGFPLAQEAVLTALTTGAPTVTADSEFLTCCGYTPTGVAATDEVLDEALAVIDAGITRSMDGGKVRAIVKDKPAADIVVNWTIRTDLGSSSGGGTGGGGGGSYTIGAGLKLDPDSNTLSVDTADAVEQDDTRPVTSAAVFATTGNIDALLSTI